MTDSFQHILTLISIIIGLGMTQILTNINLLIKERRNVRFHWLPLYWAVGTFFLQVQWWWGIYKSRGIDSWDFLFFTFMILNPISMYLASGCVLPKPQPGVPVDLRQHYKENQRWFFLLSACNPLLDILRGALFFQRYVTGANIANAIAFVLLVSMAVVRNERYHVVGTILLSISLAVFITVFSFRLG